MYLKWKVCACLAVAVAAVAVGSSPEMRYWCASIAFGAVVVAFLLIALAIVRTLKNQPEISEFTQANAPEIHSMEVILRRYPSCVMPTSSWSMRFSNLHALLDVLDECNPGSVVECGSGMSTILVASWLSERGKGGSVVSIDHDKGWAEITQKYLQRSGLDKYSRVVHAALEASSDGPEWYSKSILMEDSSKIDLLIIDGPPAGTDLKRMARMPALSHFYERLSPKCVVILDDAFRPGEKEIVKNWTDAYPEFKASLVGGCTGLAVLRRN